MPTSAMGRTRKEVFVVLLSMSALAISQQLRRRQFLSPGIFTDNSVFRAPQGITSGLATYTANLMPALHLTLAA
jgi:hypothetical protein